MSNDQEEVVEIEEIVEETDDEGKDTTDWKALALKNHGIAQRFKTKLEKSKIDSKVEKKVEKILETKKEGFDYAEKAFLKASGVTPTEFALVEEVMKATGKSLDDVLESKYFQAELKEQRENKASKDAIPSGSKRSTSSARDEVDYWIAKGTLPPADQRELRTKVVNARLKAEKAKSVFSSQSVA